ncbi:MAG: GtrA family protein [Planctomycetes bacterium]|nr:GtrA family protein [Planctomycetota bacterium]
MIDQFIKFTGVGAVGTVAHYATLVFLVHVFAANAVIASSAGAIIGALVNYILNYHYTFSSSKNHRETIWKFFTIATIGFILNGLVMTLLTEIFTLIYLAAQIITTGIILIWNFFGNQLWTFNEGADM